MLAANLAAFLSLKRSMARLNRDVIFLATAHEEGGGDASIRMLIAKHWDTFAAGYALNQRGHIFLQSRKVQYIGVQASENGAANIPGTARRTSGPPSPPAAHPPRGPP